MAGDSPNLGVSHHLEVIRAGGQLTSHAGVVPNVCPPYVASPNFTPWYGEVAWSSHLAQGCYRTAGPSQVSHYGAMPAGWSPIHVLTRLMIALTSVIKHKTFAPCYVSPHSS